ncbi:MAG TPA: metalloregulator ArsR/SmtB family transcription factor [Solirubrobacteraceae bacterium]|nr:metalloregulator ArsR/SmtB family transcription factor [Solirubrobacteraceae bacterium]
MVAPTLNAPFRLPESPAEPDLLAKYFRVLGDRTRLRVLELVADRERSVGELVALLGEPQSKVSNHLACLRWCGFVDTRREHRTVHYRLADDRVAAVVELGRALLHDNAEHVAACARVDGASC